MILTDLSNAIKNLWVKISFHKHFKTILEYILVLLIRKTAALSKCNSVFFSVKIGTVELRKSNILAPKHGGDGVILASVIWLACAVHIIQVSG